MRSLPCRCLSCEATSKSSEVEGAFSDDMANILKLEMAGMMKFGLKGI